MLHTLIGYFAARMSFERINAVKICNGIMFNFYPGVPHITSADPPGSLFVTKISDGYG